MTTYRLPHYEVLVATTDTSVTVSNDCSYLHFTSAPSSTTAYVVGRDTALAAAAADESWPVYPSPADPTCVPVETGTLVGTTTFHLYSTGTPTVAVLPCNCNGND